MALSRRTTDRNYATFREVYRLMLSDREQYLVRTIRGSEVLARWDATERQFRRLAATSDAPRNEPIPSDLVAAVATARSPGSQGTRTRWCPFAQCQHDTAAPKLTVGVAILAVLTAQGPKTTAQLRELLAHLPPQTIRTTVVNLAGRQQIGRSIIMDGNRRLTAWTVGAVTYEPRKPTGRPMQEEAWTPVPWIHPIRRRLLGLPVATPVDDAPLDFSHPMRRVAA
jgi:hypothetical protein